MTRTETLVATLNAFFQNMLDVRDVSMTDMDAALAGNTPSVFDGPVVLLNDGIARGLRVAIFVDEGDNLDALRADVYKALHGKALDMQRDNDVDELLPTFSKSEAVLDDADFHIGEVLHFLLIEHSASLAA
jgi:hypothetical protein